MWLFTRRGFFSVVATAEAGKVQVRGRTREHFDRLREAFPRTLKGVELIETDDSDYRFRIVLPEKDWAALAKKLAEEPINYRNFKTEAARVQGPTPYTSKLHDVWSIMRGLQAEPEAVVLPADVVPEPAPDPAPEALPEPAPIPPEPANETAPEPPKKRRGRPKKVAT